MTLKRLTVFPWRGKEIIEQVNHIAFESLPIIVIATAFAGLVISGEMAWHMNHAVQSLDLAPGFTGQFIFRELGVAIPALLVAAKVGASMTAEIATMKNSEQLDALKILHIDPIDYLVLPRWVGCSLALMTLTMASISVTIFCAMISATMKLGFNPLEYFNILQKFVGPDEILSALVKSAIFGSVIPIMACHQGFLAQEGAQGVGEATTQSVVQSTLLIIFLDFFLTYCFS